MVTAGGDHWRCLHGGVGAAGEEREATRSRDRPHGPGPAGRSPNIQDPPPTRGAAEAAYWYPQR